MSRIRSIHPGLFRDEAFMSLTMGARVLLMGVWTECDDRGVFEWKPLTIKATLFPADALDVGSMEAMLSELVTHQCVMKVEHSGRSYGLVRNFCRWQRPKKPSYKHPFLPEWGSWLAYEEDSTPPVPHQSPTATEKSPQREEGGGNRRRKEEGEKRGESSPPVVEPRASPDAAANGTGRDADPPSGDASLEKQGDNPLGTAMQAWWLPNADTLRVIGSLVPPAEVDGVIDRFITHHVAAGTLSRDWNATLLAALRKPPAPAKRKAKPRVVVDKLDTKPPPEMISDEAKMLAAEIVEAIGLPKNGAFAFGAPGTCHTWLAAGWARDVILNTIREHHATGATLPDRLIYYQKMIARAHANLSASVPTATPRPAEGNVHVITSRRRRSPDEIAAEQLAAIDREGEAASTGPQEAEGGGRKQAAE